MTANAIELMRRLAERWDRADIEGGLAAYTDDVDYFEVGGR